MEITKGRAIIQIDSKGKALPRGKGQRWERSVRAGEDPGRVARELLWARYRFSKSGKDFNRRLSYPTTGIV